MDAQRKKELKESYANRHPDMGIVSWKCNGQLWAMPSTDIKADYNGMSFQLKLGSWPNKELQKAYNENPDSFIFTVEKELEYKDLSSDYMDDLMLLFMEYMDEHPQAREMKKIR